VRPSHTRSIAPWSTLSASASEMRRHGVSGVAQQGEPVAAPSAPRLPIDYLVEENALLGGRRHNGLDPRIPAGETGQSLLLATPFSNPAITRGGRRPEPVDAVGAQQYEAEDGARTPKALPPGRMPRRSRRCPARRRSRQAAASRPRGLGRAPPSRAHPRRRGDRRAPLPAVSSSPSTHHPRSGASPPRASSSAACRSARWTARVGSPTRLSSSAGSLSSRRAPLCERIPPAGMR
jgi:hypothetical protein